MYDAINEAMFDFAMTVKSAIQRGWELVEVQAGERRLGIGPSLIIRRGYREEAIRSPEDLEDLIRCEVEEEDRKKWEKT